MISRPMPSIRLGVPGKYRSITVAAQADGLEDLGAAVAQQRADAHLAEDLEQAGVDRPCA